MRKSLSSKTFITVLLTFIATVLFFVILFCVLFGDLAGTYLKLAQIDLLVKNNYYGETENSELDTAVCEGYISSLEDDYADYYPLEESKEKFDGFDGNTLGMGVVLTLHPDDYNYYIISVSKDSPADKAGIKPTDRIVKINGQSIDKENYGELYNNLKGEEGESVALTLLCDEKEIVTEVIFENYIVQSVYYRMIGEYGYVQITTFNGSTVLQFTDAVEELINDGAKALIFDLRDNGGGTTDSVAAMVDYLVPQGDILSAKYIDGSEEVLYTSDNNEINIPMVALVNKNTASSSEIFAASIRDFDKGILIGNTTFGKGIMQRTYKLIDGSAVKFTVARYFTNSGFDYDGVGLTPDINVDMNEYQQKYYYMLSDSENPYITAAIEALNEK